MARVTTYYSRLTHRGALGLSGPDVRTFLQGQTTCDITRLALDQSVVGAYCTPQGRIVCDFRAVQLADDQFLLLLEADLIEAARATFSRYIVFSKAELVDASEQWDQFALWGPDAAAVAGKEQAARHSAWQDQGIYWVASDVAGGFEACVPVERSAEFTEKLAETLEEKDVNAWRLAEIQAGIGHVCSATSELFLPQMLNYQHTGHVSFSKGCYTGQEVVARMHYRGKVKRSMVRATAPAGTEVSPADRLYSGASDQPVGQVVQAARMVDGQVALLAVVAVELQDSGARLGQNGPPLEFSALVYDSAVA